MSTVNPGNRGLIEALHVSGPAPPHADKLMFFGQFVGSLSVAWSGAGTDGRPAVTTGELQFGRVLGGRAVQDIWIVPGRQEIEVPGREPAFHGTMVRFYDPAIDVWRSTWIEPVNGRVRRFIGRPAGGDIIQLSDEEQPWLRWRFTEITPNSPRWTGETWHDAARTRTLDEDMRRWPS